VIGAREPTSATVLVVEPMSSGLALPRAAHQHGYDVAVVSFDQDDRRLPDWVRPHIDHLIRVDTNDEGAVLDLADRLAGRARLAAVIPGFEYYVPLAARVAARLGLPGLPVSGVDAVRDKALMLDRLDGTGLRIPAREVVFSPDDLAGAAARVGFPCVLKPVASSGSVHVRRADSVAELREAYRRLVDDPMFDLGRCLAASPVLVTGYLPGPELSVDGHVVDGHVIVASVTSKLLGPEPNFVELGHIVQADLDMETRRRVELYAIEVVRALGIGLGPFHCEVRLVAGQPVLIEIGARLPGDHIAELIEMVGGVSLVAAMVSEYTGGSPPRCDVPRLQSQAKVAAIRYFTAPAGVSSYRVIRAVPQIRALPGFVRFGVEIGPDEPIPPAEDGRCRIGYVMFTADSYTEAVQVSDHIGGTLHVE
jgi:biotin carboxylase